MSGLEGKSVVITGAGNGIGAAYARAAAAAGAQVVVNDINAEAAHAMVDQIRRAGDRAIAQPGDIRSPDAAAALIKRCIAEFGAIDGLVNNAAISRADTAWEAKADDLRAMLEVNVLGLFHCGQAALGAMMAQGSGSIINITSGAHTGQPTLGCYGATKGAVASLTYTWAGELRDHGVRVNAVSPVGMSAMGSIPGLPPAEANAPAVLFLLSDRSRDVTGQILRIHGSRLSLMCHPANRAPVLERTSWTMDTVAEAFNDTLGALQLPTNVATYDVANVETGFGAW